MFNDIQTSSVFTHGGSGGIIVNGIYQNNSGQPKLQGVVLLLLLLILLS